MNLPDVVKKAQTLQALHATPGIFEVPNPWDAGSAILLEKLGARALATSSGASARVQGLSDGRLGRDAVLAHCRQICTATTLPVIGDLENGFAHEPAGVAETIRLAGQTGLVGGSVEDYGGHDFKAATPGASGIYPFELAVTRIAAAAQTARALPFAFCLTARCENHLRGVNDLQDTIRRLQAYEAAGADALFAPALPDLQAVQAVCSALKKPFNFMVGIPGKSFSRAELQAAGVKRISFGTVFYRTAMAAAKEAAQEALQSGTYSFVAN